MKITKKNAVLLGEFLDLFLGEHYYPFDDREAETIAKVAGFALYHSLLEDDALKHYEQILELLPPKPMARLDIDERDAEILISMIEEVYQKETTPKEVESTVSYLRKEFFQ